MNIHFVLVQFTAIAVIYKTVQSSRNRSFVFAHWKETSSSKTIYL